MGPVKLDFFFGKLSGNEFPPRPLIHGEKISFKPTRNLEFGFSRTARVRRSWPADDAGSNLAQLYQLRVVSELWTFRESRETNGGL